MKTRREILIKFYDETYDKLEKEKKKYRMFKEVLDTFEVIQSHAKEMSDKLRMEEKE